MTRLPTRVRTNERKICDAVARVLEARSGSVRHNERCPENEAGWPPLDYAFDLSGTTFALEHTQIEPFPDQIRMGIDFSAFVEPIQHALDYDMPRPGMYHLYFDINPTSGLGRRVHADVRSEIIAWVRDISLAMRDSAPERGTRANAPRGRNDQRETTIRGVRLILQRQLHWNLSSAFDGRLFIGRYAPPQYERMRLESLGASVERKLPKLNQAISLGATAILVLENQDLPLTNHVIVGEALESLLQDRDDQPSEIFFVDTAIRAFWTVCSIYKGGTFFPDEESESRYIEFNPDDLRIV